MKDLLLKRRTVDIEVSGHTLTIRNISERERATMMEGVNVETDGDVLRKRLVSLVLCKVNGEPVTYTEAEVDDIDFAVVNAVTKEAQALCGFGDHAGN